MPSKELQRPVHKFSQTFQVNMESVQVADTDEKKLFSICASALDLASQSGI